MNKKIIGAIIALVVVICGYLYATPYLVLNSIKKAAQAGDSEKVSAYIDYPSVRQSFKDQVNAHMVKDMASKETNDWEALGAMMATVMVDKMVDAVITPEGMTLMLQGKDFKQSLKSHNIPSSDESSDSQQYKTRYLSMNLFEARLKNTENEEELKIILERDGLSWKVKKIVIPADVMQPKQEQKLVEQPKKEEEIAIEAETPSVIEKTQVAFDFSGIQKGAELDFCPRFPCTFSKILSFNQISNSVDNSEVELTVVDGLRNTEVADPIWEHTTHKIQIRCSLTNSRLNINGHIVENPMSDSLSSEVLWGAETYMKACHNYTGQIDEGIRKFGYNVQVSD